MIETNITETITIQNPFDKNGEMIEKDIKRIFTLIESETLNANLSLMGIQNALEDCRFPLRKIAGNFTVSRTRLNKNFTELEEIQGNLIILSSNFKDFENLTKVGGNLVISKSNGSFENLKEIGGDIYSSQNHGLVHFSKLKKLNGCKILEKEFSR